MIYNASGINCSNYVQLVHLFESDADCILTKSCTIEARDGNEMPRYFNTEFGSINSMGLPNLGYKNYIKFAEIFKKNFNKPYIISICGLTLEDNVTMVKSINLVEEVDGIEVNLSCPNVENKPQIGYDFETMDRYLNTISSLYSKSIGIKLPPYFDPIHFDKAASIINKYDKIKYVTCINSLGNGLVVDTNTEKSVIKPKGGLGGIGGKYCLPIALSNVRQFYLRLKDKDIIGCGGIESGDEMFQHILCGAKSVQIGTKLHQEGVKCFHRIKKEFEEILEKKGYKSIDDFRGKLN